MIVFLIISGFIAVLCIVFFLPIHLHLRLSDKGNSAFVSFLFFRFLKIPESATKREKETPQSISEAKGSIKKSTSLEDLKLVGSLLSRTVPKIPVMISSVRISRFCLKIRVGADNAADTAENYGMICSFFGLIWGPINEIFLIRNKTVDISCGFERNDTEYLLNTVISINLFSLIRIVIPGFWEYFKSQVKISKGGIRHGR